MRLDNPPRCLDFYPRSVECRSDANNSIAMVDSSTVVLFSAVALLYCAVALLYCSIALLARTNSHCSLGFHFSFINFALRLWVEDQSPARPLSEHRTTRTF